MTIDKNVQTTEVGIPVADNQNSLTAGGHGPILLQDHYLIEKMAQFNRERVPERVVHAKGAGAHGYFESTADVSQYTKADFLKRGSKTPVFVRFSTVAGERGAADSARDPRGFAVKFYTQEGNYDLVGNNTPVFFIRDPMKFSDFIHTQKRRPDNNLRDPNLMWDFWSRSPESLHQVTTLFSDRGTPKTHRHMNGYGSHTFKWVNADGKAVWVKYHFKTESGHENWTAEEADEMAGVNPDYATADLYNHIAEGGEAAWRVEVQIMPEDDAWDYRFNPFDLTKVWPHADYPPMTIGRMVLNRNPANYFAEVEQSAFEPSNMVPGVEASPDKMLQGRLFSYPDAHRYRIGTNYQQLPVNAAQCPVRSYSRDGAMRFDNFGGAVNYEPNGFGGPSDDAAYAESDVAVQAPGRKERTVLHKEDNDYVQPGDLYRLLNAGERARLVANIAGHMKDVDPVIQARQIQHFLKADPEYGARVAEALGHAGTTAAAPGTSDGVGSAQVSPAGTVSVK